MVRYLKRLKSSKFVRVKAFPMYGGIGVSAPSLHRESTDSLINCGFKLSLGRMLELTLDSWQAFGQRVAGSSPGSGASCVTFFNYIILMG